ncbi:unnamed protein product, partial [Oppiella nova]
MIIYLFFSSMVRRLEVEGVDTKGPEGVIQVEDHETRHSSDQTHCYHNSPLPQLTVNTDIIYGIQCQHKLKTNTTLYQNKWFEMSLKTRHSLLEYRFGDLLGKGTYGTVYKAFKKGNPEEVVAIKCVHKSSLSKQSIDDIINEISITKKVKNEFIVELKDFQWTESHIYLVFEFCSGGELAQLIRKNKRFSEPIVRHFLQQIATALKTLRSHSIAHMDLKPQNILISSKICGNCWRNVVLKIADFGFAQYLRSEDSATSLRGSPLYMAPEILLGTKYDASVDLWSV